EETVSFEHFRAENGLLVSATMKNGKIVTVCFEPERNQKVLVKKKEILSGLICNVKCESIDFNNAIELDLRAGVCYSFETK
ncbi:MAG: hypothetical protein RR444_05355, partial [Oscillospiraceae bacterium]